jgi:putative membrane protein
MIRWLLAFVHLLALPIGAAALLTRASMLRRLPQGADPRRAFVADNWWSLAAVLWIGTGLTRYMGSSEKGADYYEQNAFFLIKMVLLVLILALELPSVITLVKWRIRLRKGAPLDLSRGPGLARLNYAQVFLALLMVACASAMARGIDL